MAIEVTVRRMHGSDEDLQAYAASKAEELTKTFPRIEHVHVILDIEKHRHMAEFVVQARNHIKVEAEESSDNMRASIDLATAKVEKQLRRLRDKVQDHKAAMRREEEAKLRELEV